MFSLKINLSLVFHDSRKKVTTILWNSANISGSCYILPIEGTERYTQVKRESNLLGLILCLLAFNAFMYYMILYYIKPENLSLV